MNDLRTALNIVLDRAIAVTGADFGNIQIVSRDGGLRIVAQRGFDAPFLEFFRVVKHDRSACSAALRHGRRVVVRDVRRSREFTPSAQRVMQDADVQAVQSTPIVSDGKVIGVLSTHYRLPHVPRAAELARIDSLAQEAADLLESNTLPRRPVDPTRAIEEFHDSADGKSRIVRGPSHDAQ